MQNVTAHFLPTLGSAHGMAVRVDIIYNGATVAENIPIVGGEVSVDRGSDVRRALNLTVPDPAVFPSVATDPYSVYGQRLYVQRGVTYLDGSTEWVPLGFFVIEAIGGDIHTGPLTIHAMGLETLIRSEPFTAPTSTRGLSSTNAFIQRELEAVIPGVGFVSTATLGTHPIATASWDTDSDRWAALQEVARGIGAELFVDALGTFRMSDVPDPLARVPVWTVGAGEAGVMVSADRALSSDGVYNRVIARGENAADNVPPVSATATISASDDPLRYGGPFGRRTYTYSSSLITTAGLAQASATATLRIMRAPNATLSLESVPNPALDAGDCIRVVYGNGRPPEVHAVQSLTIPLSHSGVTRIETVSGREEL